MDPSRKANREDTETTLQYQSPQDAMLVEELNEQSLKLLLTSIGKLEGTPAGAAELQRRTKLFGQGHRVEGESSGQFYTRLRHWLGRELPLTKSPIGTHQLTNARLVRTQVKQCAAASLR